MSLKSRARSLQTLTGWPLQKCEQAILGLGNEPKGLVARSRWPLKRADAYLVDRDLDPEYAEATSSSRYVSEEECKSCGKMFFSGVDKKGIEAFNNTGYCPDCLGDDPVTWECPRCGETFLGEHEGVCDRCFSYQVNKDD